MIIVEYLSIEAALSDPDISSSFVIDWLGNRNQKRTWLSAIKGVCIFEDSTHAIASINCAIQLSSPGQVAKDKLTKNSIASLSSIAGGTTILSNQVTVDCLNMYQFKKGDFFLYDSTQVDLIPLFDTGFILPAPPWEFLIELLFEISTIDDQVVGRDPF